jgi:hypothetical protein
MIQPWQFSKLHFEHNARARSHTQENKWEGKTRNKSYLLYPYCRVGTPRNTKRQWPIVLEIVLARKLSSPTFPPPPARHRPEPPQTSRNPEPSRIYRKYPIWHRPTLSRSFFVPRPERQSDVVLGRRRTGPESGKETGTCVWNRNRDFSFEAKYRVGLWAWGIESREELWRSWR